ncbi:zona pellucida sperm-binding protein 3-like [Aquarana catesbeiana]|uniref:zona pellucida sperm-binding protein 3-like n=1 Tax=Aquarana catesbeiana TaxID=8400 RepID=UPI003CC9FB3C
MGPEKSYKNGGSELYKDLSWECVRLSFSIMVFWVKQSCWLFLVVLVVGQAYASLRGHALSRKRRHSDHWWRVNQPVSGMGSSRRVGWGASDPGLGWDTHRRYPGAGYDLGSSRMDIGQPRQQVAYNPVSVVCDEDKMVVSVQRDLFGNGNLVKVSDLSLGSQPCNPDASSSDTTVVFRVGLQDCGNVPQMTADLLMYSTFLTYNPSSATNLPITRSSSAVITIKCYYPRHDNVSSKAIHPTWVPFSSTETIEEKLNFSLRLMNDDWSGPSPSIIFELGEPLNIEAAVDTDNHVPMRILVDRCVASLNQDTTQGPSYEIIAFSGCMVDGKQEDSSSAFRTPRSHPNKLQFSVDAFKFVNVDSPVIFITCFLRAAADDTSPDVINKACSYSKTSNSWFAVEGPNSICSCCELGKCDQTTSRSRRLGLSGGSRQWKREATFDIGTQDEEWFATLGPLYVVGSGSNKALKLDGSSSLTMEIWMVAGVCSLWLVALMTCILVWTIKPKKTLLSPQQ